MATDVLMPQMGESIAEGTITKWLKKVGDPIERDEPLYEISTDKVDAEIPSPASGILTEIIVGEGETVEVKTIVARIGEGAETATETAGKGAEPDDGETPKSVTEAPRTATEPALREDRRGEAAASRQAAAAEEPVSSSREERIQTRSSPLVRKIAVEHGIDIAAVEGSGVHGRVTKQDILEYVQRLDRPSARPVGEAPAAALTPGAATEVGAGDRVEPMSRMRQIIAEHMVASKRTSAHVHTFYEIDMSRVDALRREHKDRFMQAAGGAKLSYTVFTAKAVIDALRAYPMVNASVQGTDVVFHGSVHLGVAVALEWGLIVPVIRDAQDLSMVGLAKAITDLATRARERKLNPDEIQGSTFTITNPGSFGSLIGTPIINQPNVAILGMGKVEKRVVAIDETIGIRPRMYVVLGYDHRLIDGATGEMFLSHVTRTLENFDEIAL